MGIGRPLLFFMGLPGVGKGTFARLYASRRLSKDLKIPVFTMGDEIRAIVKSKREDDPLYSDFKVLIGQGKLINDGIAFAILRNRLKSLDTANGLLLDGYPRTLAEVRAK